MKRRGKTILILLGVIAVALILVVFMPRPEPMYRGKNVSFWLEQKAAGTGDWTEITNAFYQIGPKAIPYIAARLRRDNSWLAGRYRQAWPHLPLFLRKKLSPPKDPFKEVSAVNVFANIGPSAIPSLIVLLKDDNAAVRSSSAWALESLRRSGYGDDVSISALAGALSDPDANVRLHVASALGEFGPKAGVAVPALGARLKDDDKGTEKGSVVFVRAAAARALGKIGPGAQAATSNLTQLLYDPEPYLRMEATIALWRINRQASEVLPLLITDLSNIASPIKWEIFQALGEMGPDARAAVPAITIELKSRDSRVRQQAAESLWRIDREQAPVIVDALIEPLDDPADLFSVLQGAKLLGEIGPEARRAVPSLINLLKHPYPPASNAVAKALVQIDPEAAAKAGVREQGNPTQAVGSPH